MLVLLRDRRSPLSTPWTPGSAWTIDLKFFQSIVSKVLKVKELPSVLDEGQERTQGSRAVGSDTQVTWNPEVLPGRLPSTTFVTKTS